MEREDSCAGEKYIFWMTALYVYARPGILLCHLLAGENHWPSAEFYCHETLSCLPIFCDLFCNFGMDCGTHFFSYNSLQHHVSIPTIFPSMIYFADYAVQKSHAQISFVKNSEKYFEMLKI